MKKCFAILISTLLIFTFSCKEQSIQDRLLHYYRLINAKKGLKVINLKTNKSYGDNSFNKFYMGSMMRLPVLISAFYLAEKNRVNLEQRFAVGKLEIVYGPGILKHVSGLGVKFFSMRELARIMMQCNDATATDLIINAIGIENINKALKEMDINGITITADNNTIAKQLYGLTDDKYKYYKTGHIRDEILKQNKNQKDESFYKKVYSSNNLATPESIAKLLKKLYNKKLFSKEKTKQVLELMKSAIPDKLINFQMPKDTNVYTTGTFSNYLINDAGIIDNGKVKLIIVLFNNYNKDGKAITLRRFAFVTRLAYENALNPKKEQ